jgi:hypothetical protein
VSQLDASGVAGHRRGLIPARPARRRLRIPLVTVALLAATGWYAGAHDGASAISIRVQAACLLAALLWVALLGRDGLAALPRRGLRSLLPHPAWLLVAPPLVLRVASLGYLPPAGQTGFEELETGSNASAILGSGECGIEFRYTNLLAAAGLLLRGGSPLEDLRLPFQVAGCLGVVCLVLCLRALEVGWLPTLLIAYTAATLRWLVIAGGVADELYAGIPLVAALLWLAAKSGESAGHGPAWAGAAGICSGIIMYEYTSFRVAIALGFAWLVWLAAFPRRAGSERSRTAAWLAPACLLVTLCLVAMPTILDIARDPAHSTFAEAFVRHGSERAGLVPAASLSYIREYARTLAGLSSAATPYLTPTGEPAIPLIVGSLFAFGVAAGLIAPRHGFARALALTVIITIAGAAATANNAYVGRMSPLLPMLLVLAGLSLDSVQRLALRLSERIAGGARLAAPAMDLPSPPQPRRLAQRIAGPVRTATAWVLAVAFAGLAWLFSAVNLEATRRMSRDPDVLSEWANDDYATCRHVGLVARPGQRVFIYSPDRHLCCPKEPLKSWLYPELGLEVHPTPSYDLAPENYAPGDLVVVGTRSRGLTADEMSKLLALARETGSSESLQTASNIAGRMCVASVCIRCE